MIAKVFSRLFDSQVLPLGGSHRAPPRVHSVRVVYTLHIPVDTVRCLRLALSVESIFCINSKRQVVSDYFLPKCQVMKIDVFNKGCVGLALQL